jgi:hypothetical protein
MSVDQDVDNDLPDRAEVETEARKLGWVPEEEFRGNKDHWVDADEFVERGRTLMPILRQNNRRLQGELLTRDREIDNLKSKLENMEKVQDKLEKHYTAANKRAVELAKVQLREELKQAREDNDVDAEMVILDKLDDVRKRENDISEESKKVDPPAKKPDDNKDGYTPEFRQWMKENPWFDGKSPEDKKKTKLVTRIAEDLREEGSDLKGVEFFDECVRLYEKQYGDPDDEEEEDPKPRRRAANKVDVPSSRGGRSGSKGYADLPADAKQACDEDIEEFVGADKKYKTAKEWRDQYAKIYFAE